MRNLVCAIVSLTALISTPALAGEKAPKATAAQAASAESRGVAASYRGPTVGHGYTADARRRADCLASYPRYDPRIDRIRMAGGSTQRCTL